MPPTPKPANQRQRTNRVSSAATFEAPAASKVPLPGGDERWHPLTLSWWDIIWASPMALEEWIDADVPALLVLADIVNRYWIDPDPKLAAEMRMQNREFGLTPMSRRSLQWEIKRLAAIPAAPAAPTRRPTSSRQKSNVLSILSAPSARGR